MLPDYLTEDQLDAVVLRGLDEDLGSGDVTTIATVPAGTTAYGQFNAKSDGVLAGQQVADRVFEKVDPSLRVVWMCRDGDRLRSGQIVGEVEGRARAMLMAERLALNFMQRMSGIASMTRRMTEAVKPYGTAILDTRKTVPGLRLLDKWAVRIGGGTNHRVGLYDQILIKDNHIASAGSIAGAIRSAIAYREAADPSLRIEIEARTLEEVREIVRVGGVDIVLLDNMSVRLPSGSLDVSLLREAVTCIQGRFSTEASGNVTLETVAAIAATGVDAISSGALTHSVTALDLSLKITMNVTS